MHLIDFLSPLRRHRLLGLILFVVTTVALWFGATHIPDGERTTVYFSIKPIGTEQSLDPIESAMKVADMVSGWAKNPGFREEVLENAEVFIPNFKRKLTARKQNRTNVFWTLTLYGEERQHSAAITQAVIETFQNKFADFNQNNSFPFAITTPSVFAEGRMLPWFWVGLGILLLAFFISVLAVYVIEIIGGQLSFHRQVQRIFPNSPELKISEKLGAHDAALMEKFILSFDAPRLIGTFPKAEKHFSLTDHSDLQPENETPILLVRLGKTNVQDLENMQAIFGDQVGLIVFER